MPNEKIYSLGLDIKDADTPFLIEKSIRVESGNLVETFAKFQLELVEFMLKQIAEEVNKERMKNVDDDIPF